MCLKFLDWMNLLSLRVLPWNKPFNITAGFGMLLIETLEIWLVELISKSLCFYISTFWSFQISFRLLAPRRGKGWTAYATQDEIMMVSRRPESLNEFCKCGNEIFDDTCLKSNSRFDCNRKTTEIHCFSALPKLHRKIECLLGFWIAWSSIERK